MRKRTVITGAGVISALGDERGSLHEALCRGAGAIGQITKWEGWKTSPSPRGGEIGDFDARQYLGEGNLRPLDRTGLLAASGAQRALAMSGWTEGMREEVEVDYVLGTMFCCGRTIAQFDRTAMVKGPKYVKPLDFANTVINAATGQTAIWHRLRGANMTVSAGTVSGLRALEYATRRVAQGWCDAVLVGGVEELCFETAYAFAQAGRLDDSENGALPVPFGKGRRGFLPGEGSGYFMLEEAEAAAARGAGVIGEIAGCGSSYDPTRGADERSAAEAVARAVRGALEIGGIAAGDVGCLSLSGNGSKLWDGVEARALATVFGERLGSIPAFAIAGALGETLGASGMLQVNALLESGRKGRIPPTIGADNYDDSLPALGLSEKVTEGRFDYGLAVSTGMDGSTAAVVIGLQI